MGLFLSMSGIAGADSKDVENCLRIYASNKSGKLEALDSIPNDDNALILAEGPENKVTILYPGGFYEWEDASEYLSRQLKRPVFSFHLHDSDLWMYVLYADGNAVGHFNPIPDYWAEHISDEENRLWAGDAVVICRHWPGLTTEKIQNYLVRWDLEELGSGKREKAYPDDEFLIGDDWQFLDFMRKLGLISPVDIDLNRSGKAFLFSVPEA